MKCLKLAAIFFLFVMALATGVSAMAQDIPRMTQEELKAMLGATDLVIIDIRSGRDWSSSESKIKGAVREAPGKAASWAEKYQKDKTLVVYCA